MSIDILHLAWQAGMFEGEGSIRINKPTKHNLGALLVDLANTDESIVRAFEALWGGTVKIHRPSAGENRKPYWRWRAAAKDAEAFLLAMWPMFHTDKYRARAVIGLDFQAQKTRVHAINRSLEYRATQLEFYRAMAELNIRGTCPNGPAHRRSR